MVDALVTNFHLPESSLLAMVAAVAAEYRFHSYGDAMFCEGALPSGTAP